MARANFSRHLNGEQQFVEVAVATATVIYIGDMVYLDTSNNVVKPASDYTWNTDLATTQASFAAFFLGIAGDQSAVGDTDKVKVDISPLAVYEMDCPSGTFEGDETLGPDQTGSGSSATLMAQQLEEATSTSAIARVRQTYASATTMVKVSFASAYGMNNTNAVIG